MNVIAIRKSQELDTGGTAEYWKVTGLTYLESDPNAQVYLSGWINEAAQRAGKKAASLVKVDLTPEQTAILHRTGHFPTKELLYGILRTVPVFKDSEFVESAPVTGVQDPAPKRRKPSAPVPSAPVPPAAPVAA